jgi:hypothetical protein
MELDYGGTSEEGSQTAGEESKLGVENVTPARFPPQTVCPLLLSIVK